MPVKSSDPPGDNHTTYIPTGRSIFRLKIFSSLVGCEPVRNWYAAQKEGVSTNTLPTDLWRYILYLSLNTATRPADILGGMCASLSYRQINIKR